MWNLTNFIKLMKCYYYLLLAFTFLLTACENKDENKNHRSLGEPENYIQFDGEEVMDVSFVTYQRFKYNDSLYSDVDLCIYGGITSEHLLRGDSTDVPLCMIYIDLLITDFENIQSGWYMLDSITDEGTIQFASVLYSEDGISKIRTPKEYQFTSGLLQVHREHEIYVLQFTGMQGDSVVTNFYYKGELKCDL